MRLQMVAQASRLCRRRFFVRACGYPKWVKGMDAAEKKDWLLDERLLQSQKLAAIGELSAGIAHEINNPLAIIRQEAEWMQLLL